MTRPRVSIGMPIYNGETFLEETLVSLLEQTYTAFELIICDNASTDRTQEICQTYAAADTRIRYYRNEENLGAAPNYNRTFALAQGEYFKWCAHDDPCAPTYLARCVETLDSAPEAIMCYPKTVAIDEAGAVINADSYRDGFNLREEEAHIRFRNFFDTGILYHPVFGLMRSTILGQTPLIGSFASSDIALLGELAIRGKCYELPDPLAFRRVHQQNSIYANPSNTLVTQWFNPKVKPGRLTTRQKLSLEHTKSMYRAPLSWSERMKCFKELIYFHLRTGRFGSFFEGRGNGNPQQVGNL